MNGKSAIPDVRPPNPPWQLIKKGSASMATISFYHGDAKSQVFPIRDISNRNDAKHDPNLETLTYGLFSHCFKKERKGIVEKGVAIQFFCTTRANNTRVLTGYYRPKWYCTIKDGDYAIAAESARFVSPGYALHDLVSFVEDYSMDQFFYWKYIRNQKVIQRLKLLIDCVPDATAEYITEIHKFEARSLEQYGFMYYNRLEGFSWKYAGELMSKWGLI